MWRGTRLAVPAFGELRPTPDRVRETLFNWLQDVISGSVCLDLFAGSGALGFEAASRGAAKVVMVEKNQSLVDRLRQQAETLQAKTVEIVQMDVILGIALETDLWITNHL